ncbi:4-carboxy-4-hydroxy-2-oxoadipate aldolase (EC 4.1.3.-) [Promicromonospora umidemergens]|uniref:Putative 4-hydroxy-4-methyl-2-oxoglutarate aldolase n=1 Tax=Promicromonospora umidemergens TaxID=629679 RepID=A0ABP8XB77_9MICO|nr:dimethylmenaquinone methyltransferase [Promicromonospora umidemergens]MCP2281512.1 4-carboxy-4-hydroxy-2-oxoadipate aldolase (EC 4.1.3.-) [Promicromonospora umidemergens]
MSADLSTNLSTAQGTDASAGLGAICHELAGAGVATVYEAAGRRGMVDVELQQLVPGTRVAGPARVVACAQDDNFAVHRAISVLEPGEVLVLAMPEPRPVGLVGDLLVTQAKVHGAAAVLVDAAVRDVDDVRELGLPVWTRWVRVRGARRTDPGELDVPVEIGGQSVRPGDVVVLDRDGAVVVPQEDLADVLAATRARLAREAGMRERLLAGELSYDIHGLRDTDRQDDTERNRR